jgi:2-polyprenyl-3-methyl-5-hydroxy-6-metoxy-1,4-benzoquinol methylase
MNQENPILNEYESRGSYHEELNISRKWAPRYFRRMHIVKQILKNNYNKEVKIIDVGGGEGKLVNEILTLGFKNVTGIDPYAPFINDNMIRGSIFELPFENDSIDFLTCLDVIEHVPLQLQHKAVCELFRVLKKGGIGIISVPNMAHLKSRISFLIHGIPWRNKLEKHPGELTCSERIKVIEQVGFRIHEVLGIHLTLSYDPKPSGIFGRFLSKLMFNPNMPHSLCWSNIFLVYKEELQDWLKKEKYPLRTALKTYKPEKEDPTY